LSHIATKAWISLRVLCRRGSRARSLHGFAQQRIKAAAGHRAENLEDRDHDGEWRADAELQEVDRDQLAVLDDMIVAAAKRTTTARWTQRMATSS